MKRTTKRRLGMAGLVVAMFLIGVIVASIRFSAVLTCPPPLLGRQAPRVTIESEKFFKRSLPLVLEFSWGVLNIQIPSRVWHLVWSSDLPWFFEIEQQNVPGIRHNVWPEFWRVNKFFDPFFLRIPFWIPTLIIAIPSFLLWRQNRELGDGYCECGYDLTGNVSGVCPECGTKLQNNGNEEITSAEDSAK